MTHIAFTRGNALVARITGPSTYASLSELYQRIKSHSPQLQGNSWLIVHSPITDTQDAPHQGSPLAEAAPHIIRQAQHTTGVVEARSGVLRSVKLAIVTGIAFTRGLRNLTLCSSLEQALTDKAPPQFKEQGEAILRAYREWVHDHGLEAPDRARMAG